MNLKRVGHHRVNHQTDWMSDPEVEMHPIEGQMQHLMAEARKTMRGDRVLITTLTKRMAEDLLITL